jgi:hypothetical protein
MRFTASAFLGLALLLFGGAAWGQADPVPSKEKRAEDDKARANPEKAWSQFFFEEFLLRSCDDPTLRSALALPQPKLTVTASEDKDAKVTGRIGLRIAERFVFDIEAISQGKPSQEKTTLASLDGLPNGSSATLKLSWFGWRPQQYTTQGLQKLRDDAKENAKKKRKGDPTEKRQDVDSLYDEAYNSMMKVICQFVSTEDYTCKGFIEKATPKDNDSQADNTRTERAGGKKGEITDYLKS